MKKIFIFRSALLIFFGAFVSFYLSITASASPVSIIEAGEKLTITGELYFPQEKDPPQNLIYTFSRFESGTDAKKKIRGVYQNTKGEVVAVESTFYENGVLVRYELDQKQINDQGSVDVKFGKLYFSYTEAGKNETATESLNQNFVVSDSFVPFVQKHWDELLQGKEMKLYYPVLFLKDTVGFYLKKEKEFIYHGRPAIEFKMKASRFIATFGGIEPFTFIFDKEKKQLFKMVGRTVPREFKKGKWVDWDALILYQIKSK